MLSALAGTAPTPHKATVKPTKTMPRKYARTCVFAVTVNPPKTQRDVTDGNKCNRWPLTVCKLSPCVSVKYIELSANSCMHRFRIYGTLSGKRFLACAGDRF